MNTMKKHNIKLDGEDCIDCGMLAVTTTEECPSMNTQNKDLATARPYFSHINDKVGYFIFKYKGELSV